MSFLDEVISGPAVYIESSVYIELAPSMEKPVLSMKLLLSIFDAKLLSCVPAHPDLESNAADCMLIATGVFNIGIWYS